MISMTSLGSLGICFRFLKGELGGNSYPLEDTFRVADPNGIISFIGVELASISVSPYIREFHISCKSDLLT